MVLLPTSDASSSSAHIAMLEQQRALAQQRSAQRTAAGFGADGLTPASVGGDINCGAVVGPVSYPPRSTISRGAPVSSNTNNYANSAVGTVLLGSSSLSSGGSSSTGRPSSAAAAAGNDSISGLIAPAGFAVHCGPVVAVAGQLPTMMTMANSSGLDVTYSGGRPGTAQTQQQQQQQPQGVVVGLGGRPHSMRLLQAASQPPALIGASGIPFHRPSTSSVGSVLHPGIGGAQPMAILQPTQPQQFQFQQSMQSPEQYGGRPMTAGQQQQAPIAFTATVIPTAAGDAFDVTSGRPGAAGRGSQQPQRVIYRLQPSQSQASQQQNQQAQMQQPQFGNMAYASYACGGGNGVHQGPYSFLAGPQYTSSISSSVSGAAAAAAAVAVSDGLEVEYLAPVNPVPQPQQQHEEGDYSDAAVADTAVEELQPVVSKSASNNKRPGSGSTTSSTGSSGEREKERGATLTTTTTSSPTAASGRSGNRRPSPSSALISRDREGEGAVFDGAMLRKPADSRHLPVAPALHSAPSDADLMQHDRRGSTVKAEASSAVPFGLQSLSPPPPFEPTSLADVRRFVLTPAPQGYGPMQCTIVRDRTSSLSHRLHPVYTLYVKRCTTTTGATGSSKAQPPTAGDGTFILAGRKRPHNKTSNYIMSLDAKDLTRDSPSFVGGLQGQEAVPCGSMTRSCLILLTLNRFALSGSLTLQASFDQTSLEPNFLFSTMDSQREKFPLMRTKRILLELEKATYYRPTRIMCGRSWES